MTSKRGARSGQSTALTSRSRSNPDRARRCAVSSNAAAAIVTTSASDAVAASTPCSASRLRACSRVCAVISEALRDDGMPGASDAVLQLHDRVDDGLGARRTARHVDIDGNDPVDAGDRGIVLIEATARRAGAEGHDPLRLAHLLVDLEQDRRLLVRYRPDD